MRRPSRYPLQDIPTVKIGPPLTLNICVISLAMACSQTHSHPRSLTPPEAFHLDVIQSKSQSLALILDLPTSTHSFINIEALSSCSHSPSTHPSQPLVPIVSGPSYASGTCLSWDSSPAPSWRRTYPINLSARFIHPRLIHQPQVLVRGIARRRRTSKPFNGFPFPLARRGSVGCTRPSKRVRPAHDTRLRLRAQRSLEQT